MLALGITYLFAAVVRVVKHSLGSTDRFGTYGQAALLDFVC